MIFYYCGPEELSVGDCWVALNLAKDSGLVLSGRIGKHTDQTNLAKSGNRVR